RLGAVFDQLGCLVFLTIFTGLPGGGQSAFYVPILIEAVAIDGLDGALSGVAIFVVGLAVIEGAGTLLAHQPFAWTTVLIWSLIMMVVGASLAAVDQISFTVGAGRAAADALPNGEPARPGIRLSPREQEVLKLIAEGNSNAMIAERLHLSETTVKSYVENLLTRLSVRNRAEAVAAAARLRIL
ncbi:MAG TPA: helix-turn-helix transcriptional regulator, partial [Candidatus Dormibacteraeota bacterium]|nr:helix-turn-helix transcriptional regulator [Candidatus Dormibacteraeota bacterium]